MPSRNILLDAGSYSLSDELIGGVGIRILEFAETLSEFFNVRVFSPRTQDAPASFGDAEVVASEVDWPTLLGDADAVFTYDLGSRSRLEDAVGRRVPIVTESVPPIEHLEYPSVLDAPDPAARYQQHLTLFQRQLQVSDHFVANSGVARSSLVASLATVGRLTPGMVRNSRSLDELVTVVPLGFSPQSARRAKDVPTRHVADFLWTGGLWAWYDPNVFVDAIARCRDQGINISGGFMYGSSDVSNRDRLEGLRNHVRQAGLDTRVRILTDTLTAADRDSVLKAAKGFVCIGQPGIENETCVRLRLRDTLVHGVPLIVDPHGGTADEVRREGCGLVLNEVNKDALARGLADLMNQPLLESPHPNRCYSLTTGRLVDWLRGALV